MFLYGVAVMQSGKHIYSRLSHRILVFLYRYKAVLSARGVLLSYVANSTHEIRQTMKRLAVEFSICFDSHHNAYDHLFFRII
jgi:hypothetical protein